MIRMAMPRAAIFSSNSRTSATILGASPSVGSSTINSAGSPISERHIVSICCSPPDNTPPGASARSRSKGNSANMSSIDHRPLRVVDFMPSRRFSRTVSVGKIARSSGTYPRPLRAISCGRRPSILSPLNRIEPTGGTVPMIVLTVVERPAPLRPSKLTISPSPTLNETPCKM